MNFLVRKSGFARVGLRASILPFGGLLRSELSPRAVSWGVRLTPANWAEKTDGKSVFIKSAWPWGCFFNKNGVATKDRIRDSYQVTWHR